MSLAHLSSAEIDLLVVGEGLAPDRATHVVSCAECRRRRDELAGAIAGARAADPPPAAREAARAAALAIAFRRTPPVRWWLAVAAAVALLLAAAMFVVPALQPRPVDTDAVLLEVDEVLARDPLAAMADESVVEVVVADASEATPSSS
jgi:hypothetical protein